MSYRSTSFSLADDDAAYKEESFDDSLDADHFSQSLAFSTPSVQYRQREASAYLSAVEDAFSPSDKNHNDLQDVPPCDGKPTTTAAAMPAASSVLDDEYADDNDQENLQISENDAQVVHCATLHFNGKDFVPQQEIEAMGKFTRCLRWVEGKYQQGIFALQSALYQRQQLRLMADHRETFRKQTLTATFIQSVWRGRVVRRRMAIRNAALTIQIRVRAYLAMKEAREGFTALRKATMFVQQTWRQKKLAQKERQQFLTIRASVLTLQTAARGYLARKCAAELRLRTNAALTIQRQFRANQQMKQQRALFLAKRNAALTIQQFYRGYRQMVADRSAFIQQRQAAITLQKVWRGRVARKSFLELRTSTVTIQRHFRLLLQTRTQQAAYLELKETAIFVQRTWRLKQLAKGDRATFVLQKTSATVIQRAFRAHLERKQFLQLRQAAVTVQQRFRANREARLERSHYLEMKSAAIVIQRAFRAKIATRHAVTEFQTKRQAAVTIQRAFRAWTLGRKERAEFVRRRNAAILIQRRYREKKRGGKFFGVVVEYCAKVEEATIQIQAWWRAVRVRRAQDKIHAVLPTLRQQILDANESATPEKTIGARMVAIMERIKGRRTIKLLNQETENIEDFTNVSREICQFIVEHIEVMDSLLSATDDLNRSEPHKKLLSNILGIFLNLVTKTDTTILFERSEVLAMVGRTLRNNASSVQFKYGLINACPLVTRALLLLGRLLLNGHFLENFKSDTKLLQFTMKLLRDIVKNHKIVPARNGSRIAPPTMPSSSLLLLNTAKAVGRMLK